MFNKRDLYQGRSRLRTTAALAGARIPITVDIGIGDAIAHGTKDVNLELTNQKPAIQICPGQKIHGDVFQLREIQIFKGTSSPHRETTSPRS